VTLIEMLSQHSHPASRAQPDAAVVGFFPGLGSRSHFRDLDPGLLLTDEESVYRTSAEVLGIEDAPDRLLLRAGDLPPGRLTQQGFIGAAVLTHTLALKARLAARARERGVGLNFLAHTGESFGMLSAGVAAGALSLADGVRVAAAFTPLMLLVAEGTSAGDDFTRALHRHLPAEVGTGLVPEPFHVLGVQGSPEQVRRFLQEVSERFGPDVELHKAYSWRQVNVYVRERSRTAFDRFAAKFAGLRVDTLKPPTRFLAHSARMRPAREALDRFLTAEGITVVDPQVPLVANHGPGLLLTAGEVREALLAMADQVMDSRSTVETFERLGADLAVEFGPGARSLQLLQDNHVPVPATAFTGSDSESDRLLDGLELSAALREDLTCPGPLRPDRLRHHVQAMAGSPLLDAWTRHAVNQVLTDELLTESRVAQASRVNHRVLAVVQHTLAYRDVVDLGRGELVVQARLKRDVFGQVHRSGQAYTELQVSLPGGATEVRTTSRVLYPEVLVHLLGAPETEDLLENLLEQEPYLREPLQDALGEAGLSTDTEGVNRLLVPLALFRALGRHRPALLAQTDHYLAAVDREGWLAALVLAGATDTSQALAVVAGGDTESFVTGLREATTALLGPTGTPVRSQRDIQAATRDFLQGPRRTGVPVRLNGDCLVVSLGRSLAEEEIDAAPFSAQTLAISTGHDIARRGTSAELDDLEHRVLRTLTAENRTVLREAQQRRVLVSSVNTFLSPGDNVLGFGDGGSESLTIFLERDGHDETVVRKILSPALVTARWDNDGTGVMLPPFAKARKQAEFLQALPDPVRSRFPRVTRSHERVVPVPEPLREGHSSTFTEMIYEMSYVPGVEVSRYVAMETPPPAVVARLYEVIFSTLHREAHTVGRIPAPGSTLEASYFRKIEDRLALCRRTAPQTFSPDLLDTEHIVIDGRRYLNHGPLLRRFRQNAAFRSRLEPRFHSLVMGDSNTENIKIAQVGPLRRAADRIAEGATAEQITAALADITADSLGLMFLDPRAIGFDSDGALTRDDPMYDNKPWHNSIGHYDEIHHEHFDLAVDLGPGKTPSVEVTFHAGNPYQRAYRVRDVTVTGAPVLPQTPTGVEDHFATVMTAALGLDDLDPAYLREDPHWLVRFVFVMGTHFTAMPPFHFASEPDGTLSDTPQTQRRPVAIYAEGLKWLNWALELLEGTRTEFLGVRPAALPALGPERPAA